jgi:hypothetical protein
MDGITAAVQQLKDLGLVVLSPAEPKVVDRRGDFLFVASDQVRSVRLVQDRHLESIRSSDFLWLVAPDGYVGQSASMELGFAVAVETPIFGLTAPYDLTLRQYVRVVPSIRVAVSRSRENSTITRRHPDGFLINPHDSLEKAHRILEHMERTWARAPRAIDDGAADQLARQRRELSQLLR